MIECSRPLMIAVSACRKGTGIGAYNYVGGKYTDAVVAMMGALPVIVPALSAGDGDLDTALDRYLAVIDGLLLTGSPSNVEPKHYGGGATLPDDISDPARDATTLTLVPKAIAADIPVLGLCRGIQEINVALGGTINPAVHKTPGRFDHRSDKTVAQEVRYEPAHEVTLDPGGLLFGRLQTPKIAINSLHGQAIDQLAPDLVVEAEADDGTVEAVRHRDPGRFCYAVQWHPEWQPQNHTAYQAIFAMFADACAARARHRGGNASDRSVA